MEALGVGYFFLMTMDLSPTLQSSIYDFWHTRIGTNHRHLAAWSSGMILAQGARGPRFNSWSRPALRHSSEIEPYASNCLVGRKPAHLYFTCATTLQHAARSLELSPWPKSWQAQYPHSNINPATRNRTRDHLIAAALYSQMLYQLSYSRHVRLCT